MTQEFKYRCDYCLARFKSEVRFMKHHCKEMKREEDFKSLEGQAAHLFYKAWMKQKHHTTMTNPNAFKDSKYFTTFLKFVNFVRRTQLPDTNSFIELMVKEKIEPTYWTSDIAYGKYLEYITRKLPTEKLIEITVKTIFDVADAAEVSTTEIFEILTANEVIQLLQQRRVSPWVLLNSKKFTIFFRDNTTSEERVIMESIINPEYWIKRFTAHPADLKLARDCVSALEL